MIEIEIDLLRIVRGRAVTFHWQNKASIPNSLGVEALIKQYRSLNNS